MNMISVLTLLGGLGIFLFGMNFMGESLEKSAGEKLKTMLDNLTSSPIRGILRNDCNGNYTKLNSHYSYGGWICQFRNYGIFAVNGNNSRF